MTLLKMPAVISIDDVTVQAEACKSVYYMLRDQLLELHDWTFARERAPLLPSTTEPVYQYDYSYPLPADCIMPLEARADDWQGPELTWIVEADAIITNATDVYLKYTRRVEEPGRFTPAFSVALSHIIAATLAYPLTGKDKLEAKYMQIAESLAAKAQTRDAQKGSQEPYLQQDSWIASRNSAYLYRRRYDGLWLRQGNTE